MTLQASEVRQRVATSLAALPGWYESLSPHSAFPTGDTRPKAHKLFSVEVRSTTFLGTRKLRLSEPQDVNTQLEILLAWRLKPQATRADTDSGLDGIQTALQEALSVSLVGLSLQVGSITYSVDSGNDWMIATALIDARHMFSLS